MKMLDLGFRSKVSGTIHHLKLKYVNTNLDADSIKKTMQDIAALDMFINKKGELIYSTPISAKYVETTEDVVFDDEKKDEDEQAA